MSDVISDLKTQLLSEDEYIEQNMGNNNNNAISNETNINQNSNRYAITSEKAIRKKKSKI